MNYIFYHFKKNLAKKESGVEDIEKWFGKISERKSKL
jgi:hypothetical protein